MARKKKAEAPGPPPVDASNVDDPGRPGPAVPRHAPSILVVDDSEIVRELLREELESGVLGAEIIEAEDGKSACELLRQNEVDCVICDVEMPVMNGFEFLKNVRKNRSRTELPILLLTTHEDVPTKVAGFTAGASDFITKPWAPEELAARVETHVSLTQMHRALAKMAYTDALTGLGNRRWFEDRLEAEFARAVRGSWRIALLIIDVDHFKSVNDKHGHPVGDQVLSSLGKVLVNAARKYDLVARVGGEEFVVLLPDAPLAVARGVAERVRMSIEEAALGPFAPGQVTASVGLAEGPVTEGDTGHALYDRADTCLYAAKNTGRNRVCDEPLPED